MGIAPPLLAAVLLTAPGIAPSQTRSFDLRRPTPARCAPAAGIVADHDGRIAPRKLGEMPPASQIYTVYTVVDGCPRPVVVRKGIGADPQQPSSPTRSPPRSPRTE
jgi:hypothetical protein